MKIIIDYTSQLEDHYEADLYFRKLGDAGATDKITAVFLCIFTCIALFLKAYFIAAVAIGAGVFFWRGGHKRFIVQRAFNKHLRDAGPERLIFTEEKIVYVRSGQQHEIDWSSYQYFFKTPNTVVLVYASFQHYAVIPKRCLHTTEELSALLDLFKRKLMPLTNTQDVHA